jgi:hypothetical protein
MTNASALAIRTACAVLLLCVPVLLAAAALPRLAFGFQTEAADRLVLSATLGEPIPAASAQAAAAGFGRAPSDDGDDHVWEAEFTMLGPSPDTERARRVVSEALADAPANVRGWILLCELEANASPMRGVGCLDTGYFIAQFDWFTTDRRMQLIAREWPYLDERLRDAATQAILPMWHTTEWSNALTLHGALYDLSRSDDGRQLLRAGFIADREEMHAFNRFVIEERMNGR